MSGDVLALNLISLYWVFGDDGVTSENPDPGRFLKGNPNLGYFRTL